MSIAIQDLHDVIKIVILLNMSKNEKVETTLLKHRIDKICADDACFEMKHMHRALDEMTSERLVVVRKGLVRLTNKGARLGKDWRNLLLKKEPVLEVVAGITDGSVTGLVVIISAFIASLASSVAVFAAFLTLSAVAITNFSSFLLGGITEDTSDIITLQNLLNYSLNDIPNKTERDRSVRFVKELFTVLHSEIHRANIFAATLCAATTFLAGFVPIAAYLLLLKPFGIFLSLTIVGVFTGVFLVHYRSRRAKVHWKVTLVETVVIVSMAVIASILLGGSI
jgi:VIT1/CCC1 family predicted Fe2+/Mn2+ transporter